MHGRKLQRTERPRKNPQTGFPERKSLCCGLWLDSTDVPFAKARWDVRCSANQVINGQFSRQTLIAPTLSWRSFMVKHFIVRLNPAKRLFCGVELSSTQVAKVRANFQPFDGGVIARTNRRQQVNQR